MVVPLIALVAVSGLPRLAEPQPAAVVEFNTTVCPSGMFTQVLFWADRRHGYLLDWWSADQVKDLQVRCRGLLGPYLLSWRDGEGEFYRVEARQIVVTLTTKDPERENYVHQPIRPGIKPVLSEP